MITSCVQSPALRKQMSREHISPLKISHSLVDFQFMLVTLCFLDNQDETLQNEEKAESRNQLKLFNTSEGVILISNWQVWRPYM